MTESANSLPVDEAPEYVTTKFSKPNWVVKVNNVVVSDAILETVNLGFGSDLNSCVFSLPRNPLSLGNPTEDDDVEVIVNSKSIFTGTIKVKLDHVGRDGMKITYTATSDIADLIAQSVINASFNTPNSDFPFQQFTAQQIFTLLSIPVSGVPNVYPGAVDVTDQTKLAAAESILSKLGNYKLLNNADGVSVYALGSGGTNTRSFIYGKNIITSNLTTSSENIVDQIVVVGEFGELTLRTDAPPIQVKISEAGRRIFVIHLAGKNIRDIKVEGLTKEQPKIIYDNHIFANKALIQPTPPTPPESDAPAFGAFQFGLSPADLANFIQELNDENNNNINDDFTPRPRIQSVQTFDTEWTTLGSTVSSTPPDGFIGTFLEPNNAFIFITELPKIWSANVISGTVDNADLGIDEDGSQIIEILDKMSFTLGSIRVTYTIDTPKPIITIGSGEVVRSITDPQYRIENNTVTRFNTTNFILNSMQLRAQAEYDKTHLKVISGTISVLGDENITLGQTILIGDDLVDIVHVTHNFTNGFSTDVSITNEKLRLNYISPYLFTKIFKPGNIDSENDKRRNNTITSVESEQLQAKEQQADSEAKNEDGTTPHCPYAYFK